MNPSSGLVIFVQAAVSSTAGTSWDYKNLSSLFQVDDASEQDHLKDQLEAYVAKLPVPVHVFRTGDRSGLIRAR